MNSRSSATWPAVAREEAQKLTPLLAGFIRRTLPERYRPVGYLTNLVRQRTASQIRAGPFAGMRYIDRAIGSAYIPKLLGIYESETAGAIEAACSFRPSLIVDLGAAEGYYAIGLALRNLQARVVAFEQEESGRDALSELARLNGVESRVEIYGRCSPCELQRALCGSRSGSSFGRDVLLVCDVEGDEDALLDPLLIPELRTACILVETHEFVCPGITNKLRNRFGSTHTIQLFRSQARTADEFPFRTPVTALLPWSYLDWAVSEWRPEPMSWLWMIPRE